MKAEGPKKPSPYSQTLKTYNYKGGEITKWFVDYWDHFGSFDEAVQFMVEQMEAKKYRAFCFPGDWPAIIDKFIHIRTSLYQTMANEVQASKIFVSTGNDDDRITDLVYAFTSKFVIAASNKNLQASIVRSPINHLKKLGETNMFLSGPKYRDNALQVLEIMHPECIIEWNEALDLVISED